MTQLIALIEDEPAIRENYREYLQGYGYEVQAFSNRPDALEAFEKRLPDLAIIDVGLGKEIEGGFDLCRQLRQLSPNVPIIFLTARDNELDAISGLRLGADDYLTKDISMPHLVARIVALFRRIEAMRSNLNSKSNILTVGPLSLNVDKMQTQWNNIEIELTLTEFWMIHLLVKHPGHVKNRQQLMDAANVVLDDNTITSHIKRIRKKFLSIDTEFNEIQTVYGVGYRWNTH